MTNFLRVIGGRGNNKIVEPRAWNVERQKTKTRYLTTRNMEISIIYEDKNIIAVNKPAGVVVHSDGRTKEYTLSDWVVEHYPSIRGVGEPIKLTHGGEIPKHGIAHRLDRDTSGVMIIAKNQESFLFFKKQFQEREIEKTYRAIVYGRVKETKGIIDKPIGKSRSDFRQWSAEKGARGTLREATTEYELLKSTKDFSYLSLYPKTGRTHQIRVHLKSIGHPVLCDKLYAKNRPCFGELPRMALHAFSISINTPEGASITIEAPVPKDFEEALAELGLL
ncbi:MAG: RluA family pseudouridine synthase [Candidatus Yonathbacteria bacterium]|nr:RluA family pseudouridine synthase [Candidatus Yonathbacteria bacterium]